MISHFVGLGYKPIVGDSFTGDTPLFIRYNRNGLIDIKPISEIIDEQSINVDALGREYDYSEKPYKVLCRSGWHDVNYVYRHKTNKPIYEVSDGNMRVEVTEDHSLFNDKQEKIKPSEINEDTKLEYFKGDLQNDNTILKLDFDVKQSAIDLANGVTDRVDTYILNTDQKIMKKFYNTFIKHNKESIEYSKTCLAGLMYLKTMIHGKEKA